MGTKVTKLSTSIKDLSDEFDTVEVRRNTVKNKVEESRANRWDMIKEMSQVFQSIHNLDFICSQKPDGQTGGLNYQAQ